MGGVKMGVALMMLCVYLTAGLIELAAAQSRGSQLKLGQFLSNGQYLEAGEYRLVMQDDCNLLVYREGESPLWASLTSGKSAACFFALQFDGNAVIYAGNASNFQSDAVWSSGTCCRKDGDHVLVLQLDGNVVIYNGSGQAIWASGIKGQ